ncbi:rho GTPase-activating protein 27 isoform X2 [Protopterus annectens]|uniref:rho GTPase-activating protein 27 isoform X2 n=1 Tax=Protopterus annectens TaxID=7888 RepID=UPI001CF94F5A|nr:rho GTPase-activating protein 27 isoform X2 [Protopterus annectens]
MSGSLNDAYILVEYAFEYKAKDGRSISILPNERYRLVEKTNNHWWQVQKDEHSRPFYIPAKYVRELLSIPQLVNGFEELQEMDEQRHFHYKGSLEFLNQKNDSSQVMQNVCHTMSTFGIKDENSAANCCGSAPDLQQISIETNKAGELSSVIQDNSLISLRKQKRSSGNCPATLARFESPQRQSDRNRISYTPGMSPANWLNSVDSIRPSYSLGDLQRLEKRASFHQEILSCKRNARTESFSHPRYSTASDSENIYETIPDVIEQREQLPGRPTAAPPRQKGKCTPSQSFDNEQQDSAIYVNVHVRSKPSLPEFFPEEASVTSEEWETHTDQESGQVFYYNPTTGETTWDCPFDTAKSSLSSLSSPFPSPTLHDSQLEWETVFDTDTGHPYYYNPSTGETSWEPPLQGNDCEPHAAMVPVFSKPPNLRPPTPETDYPEVSVDDAVNYPAEDYSPTWSHDDFTYSQVSQLSPRSVDGPQTPPGWICKKDDDGQLLYTSNYTSEKWIKYEDASGQPYFCSLDRTKSQWELPEVHPSYPKRPVSDPEASNAVFKNWRLGMPNSLSPTESESKESPPFNRRNAVDFSVEQASGIDIHFPPSRVLNLEKAGLLQKTKICENGKRLRKNWSTSWTVLEGQILTFYKDGKSQPSGTMRQATSQMSAEHTLELRGAVINSAIKEKTSKKNVLELKTRDGDEYLIHHDKENILEDWYQAITASIRKQAASEPDENHKNEQKSVTVDKTPSTLVTLRDKDDKDKKGTRTSRLLSMSSTNQENDPKKVRSKLRKLLMRRPTLQSVKEKGYIKDQVFGCHLDVLCKREKSTVPLFVEQCIQAVEKRGLDIDGLYRVSGNLAVIQKLRFKVDHEENLDLDDGQWEDVHILTGALKLFFRELPEPLFPFSNFQQFITAIKTTDTYNRKIYMRDLVHSLPLPNQDTMKLLFGHLRRVIEYHDKNRMSVKSLAIVFGPTLLKPEDEGANIALYTIVQSQIVEHILNEYEQIFLES